ncbi:hypothetical protein C8E00_10757 [Chromohalobacter marismortui]|uniref:DUF4136 domain-containing protein n=1 Tax=Chromohalobacter marismortui TaxID=42055 RepID=A0A4R7NID3_9GAMM|nr:MULTISPECIES: hypothetical protein [Chromohalobacter]MCI0510908.1 hypothetical protein [Chromohalobacter sp.]MCI0592936.1 hypothetical protein [Chromohalobacter sp.]TDU20158.1 hypothetical protein C8E00_10757 [Chromohalobacter marismortui]
MMKPLLLVVLACGLGGCQGLASYDPLGRDVGSPLPEACHWSAEGDAKARVRATANALEARGYRIVQTEVALGLVSAERSVAQPGLGAVDRSFWGRSGFWGRYGLGGRQGYSLGYFQRFGGDPVRLLRVSAVAAEGVVRVTRDSRVVDADGYLIDARPDNSAAFCAALHDDIDARMREESTS